MSLFAKINIFFLMEQNACEIIDYEVGSFRGENLTVEQS